MDEQTSDGKLVTLSLLGLQNGGVGNKNTKDMAHG